MERICVFCGSSAGNKVEYREIAKKLGRLLAQKGMGLVYGGGGIGLMGQVARAALAEGGEVIGVIPEGLAKRELALRDLTDLRIVKSMHDRKALMAQLSDGFITLPGGLGTLEEFFEVLTWAQLGLHQKPCGLLNTEQYFRQLIQFLDDMVSAQFVESIHRSLVLVDESPESLLQKMEQYQPPQIDKVAWALRMAEIGHVQNAK